MKKAEVTAFLSLIFVLLVSFITALLGSAVLQTQGNKRRLDTDAAVFSVFGEYQNALMQYYDIFAIDGSYGTGSYSETNLTDRMHYYGTEGVDHEITGIQYLTDHNGIGLREQVLNYMEDMYGLSAIKDLAGMSDQWEELNLEGEKAEEKDQDMENKLEELMGQTQPTENESSDIDTLPVLGEVKKSYLFTSVLPDNISVSEKAVDLSEQVSRRPLNTGRGSFNIRAGLSGMESRFMFHEYILKKFNNVVDTDRRKKEGNLDYEVEYMITGERTDSENLEKVIKKIFVLRLGANMMFLETNSAKQAEASSLAAVMCTVALIPEAEELVKHIILGAWAYKESRVDVYTLLTGKKLPLVKTDETWRTPLMGIFTSERQYGSYDSTEGMGYSDYLRILLYFQNEEVITMRVLDRIEGNIRLEEHAENFRMDQAVIKLRLENEAQIYRGLTYKFPAYFGYL